MASYLKHETIPTVPRLPLEGQLDLTYRCHFNCRHCWLRIPPNAPEKRAELSFDEIRSIVDQARQMGTCHWNMSGGEPMLRPDFADIFDYITRKVPRYSLNTNGSLITPQVAQLLKRVGTKMIALYGATPEVCDHITRLPGSFEVTMRGFAYLNEAGASYVVQIVPMRDNYDQFDDMVRLAESLSPHWRLGASWLYLTAVGDRERNREICRQRLTPREVVALDGPDLNFEESRAGDQGHDYYHAAGDDRLFAECIVRGRNFHVDPYGGMSFCSLNHGPALRYNLCQGSFREAWETFIPSLVDVMHGGHEYLDNCAACELRHECRWCPARGYLEHRSFSVPVEYLCALTQENRRVREDWKVSHRRYYKVGGVTIQVDADLPIKDGTFDAKFDSFRVNDPGPDTVTIRHHFYLPELHGRDLGREVYRRPPWVIYRKNEAWVYLGITPDNSDDFPTCVAIFNLDHSHGHIYHPDEAAFRKGDLHALTLFTTDQIWLARVLADRQACYLHASAAIVVGQGMLFVGHSEAGKSTIVKMLKDYAEILGDDRNIVRRWPEGWRVHGSWSHGEVPIVSAGSAPLRAVCFLEKGQGNHLDLVCDRWEIRRRLLACLIRPLETPDWWDSMFSLVEQMACEVPCYRLCFDKSGAIVDELKRFGTTNHRNLHGP